MRAFLCLAALLCAAHPVAAQVDDDYEWQDETIHAPLPLYTFDWPDIWPRHFVPAEPDVIGGCESRMAFGDWQFVPSFSDDPDDAGWLRFSNYGVFHCGASIWQSHTREELDEGEFERALIVRMGTGRARGKQYELWALQEGFLPGSTYTLLAREPDDGEAVGAIKRFHVLQRRCPADRLRQARGLDIWMTRYCAIDSRPELLALARKMLREPFLGEFTWVGDIPEEPGEPAK